MTSFEVSYIFEGSWGMGSGKKNWLKTDIKPSNQVKLEIHSERTSALVYFSGPWENFF